MDASVEASVHTKALRWRGIRVFGGWFRDTPGETLADRLRFSRGSGTVAGVEPDAPSPEQLAVLRRWTPEQRYRASRELYWALRRHKQAFIRSLHPDWSDVEVDGEVRRIFRDART